MSRLKLKDLKAFTKFDLSFCNALVPMIQYGLLADHQLLFSHHTTFLFTGSLLMAMATQSHNQVLEFEQDKKMTRTCNRPIPQQLQNRSRAGPRSQFIAPICVSPKALIISNIIYFSYIKIYTPLKQVTSMNTLIGSVIGSLSVFLGAASVPGADIFSVSTISNFLFMFSWQINHFYGIYWKYKSDYEKSDFVMLNDHQKAVRNMRVCLALNILSRLGIASTLNPVLGIGLLCSSVFSLFFWNFKPTSAFLLDPNKHANYLKVSSYKYFAEYYTFLLLQIIARFL